MSGSPALLEMTAKKRGQDIEEALKEGQRTDTTKDMNEEAFKSFQEWFKKFATKVDCEKASSAEEIRKLVEEGNKKAYLTKSLKINLSELDWNADFTPLHYAAAIGNHQAVMVLLQYVNATIKNLEKCTPLHFAAYAGHETVAKALIEHDENESSRSEALNAKDDQGSLPYFMLRVARELIGMFKLSNCYKPMV